MGTWSVMTWNVQGSAGLDLGFVADHVRSSGVDVLALQEVQRRQATRLGNLLGWSVRWDLKHRPPGRRAEGAAVLSRHGVVAGFSVVIGPAPIWSWKRRIAQVVHVTSPDGGCVIVNAHLSPHGRAPARLAEMGRVVDLLANDERCAADPAVIVGDLNETPPSAVVARLASAGWQDVWLLVPRSGPPAAEATAWTRGDRRGRPPTQRLDYVLVPHVATGCGVSAPFADAAAFAPISDHLPVVARFALPSS